MIGRRRARKDPVTPELREAVLRRDRVCFVSRVDLSHICRDGWGMPHRSDDTNRLSIEHVKDEPRMGVRAPSDAGHCLALCHGANNGVPSKEMRAAMRSYLARVNESAA